MKRENAKQILWLLVWEKIKIKQSFVSRKEDVQLFIGFKQ